MPEISATIRVVDAFSNPLDKLANGLSRAQSGFSRLKGALGGNMFGSAEKSVLFMSDEDFELIKQRLKENVYNKEWNFMGLRIWQGWSCFCGISSCFFKSRNDWESILS